MTHDQIICLVFWVVLLYPVYSPRCWRMRREMRQAGAKPSTVTPKPPSAPVRVVDQSGPKWEQDAPFPECFSDMDGEDDLG